MCWLFHMALRLCKTFTEVFFLAWHMLCVRGVAVQRHQRCLPVDVTLGPARFLVLIYCDFCGCSNHASCAAMQSMYVR